jgi:hypothetical protein
MYYNEGLTEMRFIGAVVWIDCIKQENASKEIILDENKQFFPCAIFVVERPEVDGTIQLENSQVIDKIVYRQILKTKEIQVYLNTKN